ncbi:hypothetical protein BN2475_480008 [Paraburkholderia ribeironis]|uniref:Uncharacterized protein n=1 Tax=Paraburkholderia ribeironis TaxID=1247936 RepID=A0A1N7SC61_9BURK|nr:hypothetical protein BN2475_480008 [Paraburkholderia ribeironis]
MRPACASVPYDGLCGLDLKINDGWRSLKSGNPLDQPFAKRAWPPLTALGGPLAAPTATAAR